MNILVVPFVNMLFGLAYLFGNLGWSVVAVTVLMRLVLMPLLWPSLKMTGKMKELQPKLKRLQEKYKDDKKKLAEAQMELYKQEGVNPMSGCLPQLLQVAVLIIFFSAFSMVTDFESGKIGREEINKGLLPYLQAKEDFKFEPYFLGAKLAETPSKAVENKVVGAMILPLVLLIGSGIAQFVTSKMMMPAAKADEKLADATKGSGDDMAAAMQMQTTYIMPIMTIFIGWNFSTGILLYWFVNSIFGLGQQIFVEKLNKR